MDDVILENKIKAANKGKRCDKNLELLEVFKNECSQD